MPRYEYQCSECKGKITVEHERGQKYKTDGCILCGTDIDMNRVYSFNLGNKIEGEQPAGVIVKSHIEEAKQELIREKKKLAKKELKR